MDFQFLIWLSGTLIFGLLGMVIVSVLEKTNRFDTNKISNKEDANQLRWVVLDLSAFWIVILPIAFFGLILFVTGITMRKVANALADLIVKKLKIKSR